VSPSDSCAPSCAPGIPDGTEKLSTLGLVPFSDALEEVGEDQLPGISSTFGVSTIKGAHLLADPASPRLRGCLWRVGGAPEADDEALAWEFARTNSGAAR
jgi:hypothetical protein